MENGREIPLQELAGSIMDSVEKNSGSGRFVLGITGPPAAGKSTLALLLRDEINRRLGRHAAEIAPMDGFHLDNQTLMENGDLWRKGAPETFWATNFASLLADVRRSRFAIVPWPTYDRELHEPTPGGVTFDSETVIAITEGNYLLLDSGEWLRVQESIDETWYLHADLKTVEDRLMERHLLGGQDVKEAYTKVATSDLPNARRVSTTRHRARLTLQAQSGRYYIIDDDATV